MHKAKVLKNLIFLACLLLTNIRCAFGLDAFPPDYQKRRVIISTDIGGGDADDTQSMIHFLAYANMFDLEGIVISRPRGTPIEMYKVINAYARDYKKFQFISPDYPTPRKLRALVRVGASRMTIPVGKPGQSHIDRWKQGYPKTPSSGYSRPTAGSNLIVSAANKDDPRPLYVLVWGSSTDVAQAVHDDPSIVKKIVVVSNTKDNFNYILDPSPHDYLRRIKKLRHIDGVSGIGLWKPSIHDKTKYGNVGFVSRVVKSRGSLGKLFYQVSRTINVNSYGIKMGDTATLLFIMNGDFNNPQKPSWGGRFCHVRGTNRYESCSQYGNHDNTVAVHRKDFLIDWEKRLIAIYGE